jgi:hypothetical protein
MSASYRIRRVVEKGYVLRRKADGYIWSIGETGNPDARTGVRPHFKPVPYLGSLNPKYWEMVYAERTITLQVWKQKPRRKARRG